MNEKRKSDRVQAVMYTQALCGYCVAARQMLQEKGIDFTEISVTLSTSRRREMIERSGRRSVPQIFIGEQHIGGYDDMAELNCQGKLDALLGID